jgi:quinol monooxygenase YgiN
MVEFPAKKGASSAVRRALSDELPETRRSKDGCQSLALTINQDNGRNMMMVMRWESRKHYDAHRALREGVGDGGRLAELTDTGLSTCFFDISDM